MTKESFTSTKTIGNTLRCQKTLLWQTSSLKKFQSIASCTPLHKSLGPWSKPPNSLCQASVATWSLACSKSVTASLRRRSGKSWRRSWSTVQVWATTAFTGPLYGPQKNQSRKSYSRSMGPCSPWSSNSSTFLPCSSTHQMVSISSTPSNRPLIRASLPLRACKSWLTSMPGIGTESTIWQLGCRWRSNWWPSGTGPISSPSTWTLMMESLTYKTIFSRPFW